MRISTEELDRIIRMAIGQSCWYVSVGGSTLPSFSLSMGRKLKRERPLRNKAHSEDYRKYRGESSLLVWCSWRLDTKHSAIVSSDDDEKAITRGLNSLQGKKLLDIGIQEPVWDATFVFSDDVTLKVFCDHTNQNPSFEGNWEWASTEKKIYIGPGNKIEVA